MEDKVGNLVYKLHLFEDHPTSVPEELLIQPSVFTKLNVDNNTIFMYENSDK